MERRTLTGAGGIDLALTMGPACRGRGDPTMRVAPGEVWRATRTPEGPATVHLRSDGDRILVRAWGEGATWAIEHAAASAGLHDDPSPFVPRHDVLREVQRRHPGIRFGRTDAVLEALVPSILEQKVIGVQAWSSYARLVRRYGEPAPGPGGLLLAPSAETLAGLPSYAFHPLGVERKRADTVRRAASRARRLEEATAMAPPEALARLQAIPGVGPWTAAEVARVALGDPDAVSVGDFHLPHVVAWVLAGEPRADDARMLELLEPYAGQRARAVRLIEASGLTPPRRGPRMMFRSIERM